MNDEIKDLLQMIKTCSKNLNAKLTLDSGCCKCLLDYIDELSNKIDKAIELNNQIIKDTKSFYRPTSDTIYSGDCLMDIAGQNLKILKGSDVDEDRS